MSLESLALRYTQILGKKRRGLTIKRMEENDAFLGRPNLETEDSMSRLRETGPWSE